MLHIGCTVREEKTPHEEAVSGAFREIRAPRIEFGGVGRDALWRFDTVLHPKEHIHVVGAIECANRDLPDSVTVAIDVIQRTQAGKEITASGAAKVVPVKSGLEATYRIRLRAPATVGNYVVRIFVNQHLHASGPLSVR